MKVLLRRNVSRLGTIGELVDVKSGYARNYLLPQGLAIAPTEANIKAVEADKQRYLEELARERADLEARAAVVQGKKIAIVARTNDEGHLYGSVGPAQIVAELAEMGIFLDTNNVALDPPLREIGEYDVTVRFTEEISATVQVTLSSTDPTVVKAPEQADQPEAPAQADDETPEDAAPVDD